MKIRTVGFDTSHSHVFPPYFRRNGKISSKIAARCRLNSAGRAILPLPSIPKNLIPCVKASVIWVLRPWTISIN